jgi:signal peptide peptidase SppA
MENSWLTEEALWALEPYVEAPNSGPRSLQGICSEAEGVRLGGAGPGFRVLEGGVAVLDLVGRLAKQAVEGGCSTRWARFAVGQALSDVKVSALLLRIDSPGGQVAGTHDLAMALCRFARRKPLAAYIEDVGCSAAYWIACAADAIYCNPTATVGGIGALLVVTDSSRAFERAGLRVHAVATGPRKRIGAPGQPLLPADVRYLERYVRTVGAVFTRFVQRRRALTEMQLQQVARGGLFVGQQAVKVGLVDEVLPFEEALERLRSRIQGWERIDNNRERSERAMHWQEGVRQILSALRRGQEVMAKAEEPAKQLEEALERGDASLEIEEALIGEPPPQPVEALGALDREVMQLLREQGIVSASDLRHRLEMAKLGLGALEEARAEAKRAAIRLYGAESGVTIGAQVDFEPIEVVRAKAQAWNLEADAKFGVNAAGGGQRVSAPCRLPNPLEEHGEVGAWARLSEAQRAMAIKMGFTTPDRQEAFAANLLAARE